MEVRTPNINRGLVGLDGRRNEGDQAVGDVVDAYRTSLYRDEVLTPPFGHGDAELVDNIRLARVTTGVRLTRKHRDNYKLLVKLPCGHLARF